MQDLVQVFEDNAEASKSTAHNIKIVLDNVVEFAERYDYISRNFAKMLNADDIQYTENTTEKHRALTDSEIIDILQAERNIITDITIVLMYTGFRIQELLNLTAESVNTDEWYFRGGLKTKAGKDRVVPIHSDIQPLVSDYLQKARGAYCKRLFDIRTDFYRQRLKERFGILPHDLRHTLISRLQTAGADHVCVERIVGHKSKGITDSVYTHKALDELRQTIELLNYTALLHCARLKEG